MLKGANTEFLFTLPCDYSNLQSIEIVFWQDNYNGPSVMRSLPITKQLNQCCQGRTSTQLSVILTSEETARFSEKRKAYVQMIGVTKNAQPVVHLKKMIPVYPIYNEPTIHGTDVVYLDGGLISEALNDDSKQPITFDAPAIQ